MASRQLFLRAGGRVTATVPPSLISLPPRLFDCSRCFATAAELSIVDSPSRLIAVRPGGRRTTPTPVSRGSFCTSAFRAQERIVQPTKPGERSKTEEAKPLVPIPQSAPEGLFAIKSNISRQQRRDLHSMARRNANPFDAASETAGAGEERAHNGMIQPREDGEEAEQEEAEEGQGAQVYVVTFELDKAHQDAISALRRRWFPEDLYKVDAHVTLFHALPGERLEDIRRVLGRMAEVLRQDGEKRLKQQDFRLLDEEISERSWYVPKAEARRLLKKDGRFVISIVPRPESYRTTNKAVMVNLIKPRTPVRLRKLLIGALRELHVVLTPQDRKEVWKPHYTIANYLGELAEVRACKQDIKAALTLPANHALRHGKVQGLVLWRYVEGGDQHGRWVDPERFLFYRDEELERTEASLDTANEENWPALGK